MAARGAIENLRGSARHVNHGPKIIVQHTEGASHDFSLAEPHAGPRVVFLNNQFEDPRQATLRHLC